MHNYMQCQYSALKCDCTAKLQTEKCFSAQDKHHSGTNIIWQQFCEIKLCEFMSSNPHFSQQTDGVLLGQRGS